MRKSPKIYAVIGILCIIGVFVSFGYFAYRMMSDDFLDDFSVTGIILNILLYIGSACFFMFMAALSISRYLRSKDTSDPDRLTKTCPSCGHVMAITEMSCPRCYTLLPTDEYTRYKRP